MRKRPRRAAIGALGIVAPARPYVFLSGQVQQTASASWLRASRSYRDRLEVEEHVTQEFLDQRVSFRPSRTRMSIDDLSNMSSLIGTATEPPRTRSDLTASDGRTVMAHMRLPGAPLTDSEPQGPPLFLSHVDRA